MNEQSACPPLADKWKLLFEPRIQLPLLKERGSLISIANRMKSLDKFLHSLTEVYPDSSIGSSFLSSPPGVFLTGEKKKHYK